MKTSLPIYGGELYQGVGINILVCEMEAILYWGIVSRKTDEDGVETTDWTKLYDENMLMELELYYDYDFSEIDDGLMDLRGITQHPIGDLSVRVDRRSVESRIRVVDGVSIKLDGGL